MSWWQGGSLQIDQKTVAEPDILDNLELCKYRNYLCLTGIDVKPEHTRFALCKNPRRKTPITQELTVFPKQFKNRRFRPIF